MFADWPVAVACSRFVCTCGGCFFVEVGWGCATARQARFARRGLGIRGRARFHVSCESRAASIRSDSVVPRASLPLQSSLSSFPFTHFYFVSLPIKSSANFFTLSLNCHLIFLTFSRQPPFEGLKSIAMSVPPPALDVDSDHFFKSELRSCVCRVTD